MKCHLTAFWTSVSVGHYATLHILCSSERKEWRRLRCSWLWGQFVCNSFIQYISSFKRLNCPTGTLMCHQHCKAAIWWSKTSYWLSLNVRRLSNNNDGLNNSLKKSLKFITNKCFTSRLRPPSKYSWILLHTQTVNTDGVNLLCFIL